MQHSGKCDFSNNSVATLTLSLRVWSVHEERVVILCNGYGGILNNKNGASPQLLHSRSSPYDRGCDLEGSASGADPTVFQLG